ncbi:MAG TPA: hypothetical protein VME67_14690 [Mycobacterium sp.]|nr:hypothetical protein [Mycobacterium sp.]HTX95990.1 hypothetical protein [Mycobacterium sp.]
MDGCDPQSLASALASTFKYAIKAARQAPNPVLHGIFDRLTGLSGQSSPLPDGVVGELQQSYSSPNWSSLLLFLMLEVQKPLAPSIWIGAAQPTGWSRMITLNYSPDAQQGAQPTPPVVTIGLAVLDSTATQGIWVDVAKPFTHAVSYPPKRRLAVNLSSTGNGRWELPFDGHPTTAAPAGWSAEMTVAWAPGWTGQHTPVYNLSLGGLTASLRLGSSDPAYRLNAGFGPLGGTLTPRAALGDGLTSLLPNHGDIGVHYNPSLVVEQGTSASFTLGSSAGAP